MSGREFDLLASLRARYWSIQGGKMALAIPEGLPAEQQDRWKGSVLLQRQLPTTADPRVPQVPLAWNKSLRTAADNQSASAALQPHALAQERGQASDRGTLLHERSIRHEVPAHAAMQHRPTQEHAGQGATAENRGELIASIVETGLQIATRMGDRAAAAAFCMAMPDRLAMSPPIQFELPRSGAPAMHRSHVVAAVMLTSSVVASAVQLDAAWQSATSVKFHWHQWCEMAHPVTT